MDLESFLGAWDEKSIGLETLLNKAMGSLDWGVGIGIMMGRF